MIRHFLLRVLCLSVWVSSASYAAGTCQCLCSFFHTTGGEVKVCPTQPIPPEGGKCTYWIYEVPRIADKATCVNLGTNTNPCVGFSKDRHNRDRWNSTDSGRYHTCRFVNFQGK